MLLLHKALLSFLVLRELILLERERERDSRFVSLSHSFYIAERSIDSLNLATALCYAYTGSTVEFSRVTR